MKEQTIRTFIGIPIALDLAEKLQQLILPLLKQNSKLKLVPVENYHLTLFFCGLTTRHVLLKATKTLTEHLKNFGQFELKLDQTMAYATHHQVIISQAVCINEKLMQLQNTVATILIQAGFQAEKRAYLPHITLARHPKSPKIVIPATEKFDAKIVVSEVIWYQSISAGQESIYQAIRRFALIS